MDIFTAIDKRRSVREYTIQPVEFDKIVALLETAILAPSAGNLQPWRFILVTDQEKKKQLATYCPQPEIINSAPLSIIVCTLTQRAEEQYPEEGKHWVTQDSGAAIENMLLTATALGLGSCWIGLFDKDNVRDLFQIPDKAEPQAIITLGYSEEKLKPRERDDLNTFIYFNRYGAKVKDMHLVLRDLSVEWEKQAKEAKNALDRLTVKSKKFFTDLKGKYEEKGLKEKLKKKIEDVKKRLEEL